MINPINSGRRWTTFTAHAAAMAIAGPATAQHPITVAPGFQAEVFTLIDARGLAFGPGGAFGTDLYVSNGTQVVRVDSRGAQTLFAAGLNAAYGMAFSAGGAFGDFLYVVEYTGGRVRRVDSAGTVSPFATITTPSVNLYDLAFGPGVNGFSTNAYVTDVAGQGGVPGKIHELRPDATSRIFFGSDPFTAMGVCFASGGSFGAAALIVADAFGWAFDDGGVRNYASNGTFTTIITAAGSDLYNPAGVAQGPGGVFGTDLYLSDFTRRRIYTLTSSGVLTEFASGFCFPTPSNTGDADIVFAPDGGALYVADSGAGAVYRISPGAQHCYADCDTFPINTLDIFDFLCFQNRYNESDPYACNCDVGTGCGVCDIFDFLCFQNRFDAGCP